MSRYDNFLTKDLDFIFEDLDEVFWSIDLTEDSLVLISPSCEKVYGYSQQEFYQNPQLAMDCIHPEDQEFIFQQNKFLQNGMKQDYDYRIITKNSEVKWVNSIVVPVKDHDGRLIRLSGVIKDVTIKKLQQVELERKEYLLNSFSEVTKMLLSSVNLDQAINEALKIIGVITEVDAAYVFQFNSSGKDVTANYRGGWWGNFDDPICPKSKRINFTTLGIEDIYKKLQKEINVDGTINSISNNLCKLPMCKNVKYLLWIPIFIKDQLWGFMGFQVQNRKHSLSSLDLTILSTIAVSLGGAVRRNAIEEELTKQSTYDGLTHIANRRTFDKFLEDKMKKAKINQSPISLILMDVDYFKLFNDNFGHQEGDDCLIKIANTLNDLTKDSKYLAARYGGEEFAIVMADTELTTAVKLSETIRKEIESLKIPHEFSDVSQYVTVSIGVSSVTDYGNVTLKDVVNCADAALYISKKRGRNKVTSSHAVVGEQ